MPELPEVETFKRYLDGTSLKKLIKNVEVRDNRILDVEEKIFKKRVIGKKFQESIRHGKYLFVKLGSDFIVFHFGMTGDFEYFSDLTEEPPYSKVVFGFENGEFLSYISRRLFGFVGFTENIEDYLTKKKLGPDAYKMSFEKFKTSLYRRTAVMKSALLNQSIIAGVGNIYSDEILFRTKIHPKTKINQLEEPQLKELFKNIKDILTYGIDHEGELSEYSEDLLIPHRGKEEDCPICGTEIQRYEISGRHGFFCPKCQKE